MIEIFGKPNCPYCSRAIKLCQLNRYEFINKQLDVDYTREELLEIFPMAKTFPQIKIDDLIIGGFDDLDKWVKDQKIKAEAKKPRGVYDIRL